MIKTNGGPDVLSRAVPQEDDEFPAGTEHPRVQARREVLASIRSVMEPAWTSPTPEMDVSDELLASMSLDARSISWDMVKKESERDEQSQKLVQWINEDCPGPIGDLSDDLRQSHS